MEHQPFYSLLEEWYDANHTMRPKKAKPTTITEYIDAASEGAQKKLREMLACIREVANGAKEGLKWGMPAFSHRRILVTFAAHNQHIGFYPTPVAVKAFKNELSGFVTREGSIQFPLEKPLPLDLIRKITEFRVRESVGQDGKWRTGRQDDIVKRTLPQQFEHFGRSIFGKVARRHPCRAD